MRATKTIFAGLLALSGLAACGDTLGEQALFGAGAGAGTALILDGDIATGAVVGAVDKQLVTFQ